MKIARLLPLMLWLLAGGAPDTSGPARGPAAPRAGAAPTGSAAADRKSAPPGGDAPSYEVSIASAEADRVHALELCDSKPKAERRACTEAADSAYDQAKSAAESGRNNSP